MVFMHNDQVIMDMFIPDDYGYINTYPKIKQSQMVDVPIS